MIYKKRVSQPLSFLVTPEKIPERIAPPKGPIVESFSPLLPKFAQPAPEPEPEPELESEPEPEHDPESDYEPEPEPEPLPLQPAPYAPRAAVSFTTSQEIPQAAPKVPPTTQETISNPEINCIIEKNGQRIQRLHRLNQDRLSKLEQAKRV